MDNTRAADALESGTESAFNRAFVKAIEKRQSLPTVHDQIMQGLASDWASIFQLWECPF